MPITMPATRPKPKKARAAEEPASKGARRPGEQAEPLVKLDHEGVTSPKSKTAKEALLLREDAAAGGWPEPQSLLGLGGYAPAAGGGELAQESGDGLTFEDSGHPKSPDKGQTEQDGAEESESGSSSSSSDSDSSIIHEKEKAGNTPRVHQLANGHTNCGTSIQYINKRERTDDTFNNTNEPRKHHAK